VALLDRFSSLHQLPTIVLDSSLRICEVSDSHLSLTNSTREDTVGCSIFDIPLASGNYCITSAQRVRPQSPRPSL
jgi:hypothetical protein